MKKTTFLPPPKAFYFSLILCALTLLGCVGLVGCTDKDRDSNGPAVALKSIALEPTSLQLAIGGTATLSATGTYSDGTTKDISELVTWESEDDAIASVDAGEVTGVAEGDTAIIASYQNLSAQAAVQVTNGVVLTAIELDPDPLPVAVGGTATLSAQGTYSDGTTKAIASDLVTWESDNEAVARVDAGVVTGVAEGDATVTASYQGQSAQAAVQVTTDVVLTKIELDPDSLQLAEGETATLSAQGTYSDGTTKDISALVTWESEDDTIASVNAGVVTGVKAGDTTVTASYQGQSAQAEVKVTPILVSLRVKSEAETIKLEGEVNLEAEAVYSDETTGPVPDDLAIVWTSSDEDVATVDTTGSVKGVAFGSATIAVKSADEQYPCSRACEVSVTPEKGDVFSFGKWYNVSGELTVAITWTVMQVEEATANTPKRALVVAEEALDSQVYNASAEDITWKDCSLRKWLTGTDAQGKDSTFYNNAFTEAEKAKIALTKHETSDWGGEGTYGEATQDLVFLLDEKEVKELYSATTERACKCTEWAQKQGAVVKGGCCHWWMRSPGTPVNQAGLVLNDGGISRSPVERTHYSVRPALYITF